MSDLSAPPPGRRISKEAKRAERLKEREAERMSRRFLANTDADGEVRSTLPTSVDQLTLPWARWADGRLYRLKQGKHFRGSLVAAREEAILAAWLLGKAVQTMKEQLGGPYQYLWVQFADHAIREGEPCPSCGGRKLMRTQGGFGRCRSCRASLILREI